MFSVIRDGVRLSTGVPIATWIRVNGSFKGGCNACTFLASSKANDAIAALWAAEAVDCAMVALDRSVTYAGERHAYGRPIGSFQAVKHLLVDIVEHGELARTGAQWAAQDRVQRSLIASDVMARARETIQGAIQVYGGMGFTWETGLRFYLRRVMVLDKLLRNEIVSQRLEESVIQ